MQKHWRPKILQTSRSSGLVESYFLRIFHPEGEWAAWIKYTFLRKTGHFAPIGESWFIFFDRHARPGAAVVAAREACALEHCRISKDLDEVEIGGNLLTSGLAAGSLERGRFEWRVSFTPLQSPLSVLPAPLLSDVVPATKVTTPFPVATASGTLRVGPVSFVLDAVPMSLGHNWGRRHSESYVWAQAWKGSGKDAFFFEGFSIPAELRQDHKPASSLLSLGKLRFCGREYDFSSPLSWLLNRGRVSRGRWQFEMRNLAWVLAGEFSFQEEFVAGLRYFQPNGAICSCLNSMIASGKVGLHERKGPARCQLVHEETFDGTAALEFLLPILRHGYPILA